MDRLRADASELCGLAEELERDGRPWLRGEAHCARALARAAEDAAGGHRRTQPRPRSRRAGLGRRDGPAVADLAPATPGSGPRWGMQSDELNATLLTWPAGHEIAAHVNDEREVMLVVLEGSACVTVDGAEHELAADQLLLIPRGCAARHQRRAGRRALPLDPPPPRPAAPDRARDDARRAARSPSRCRSSGSGSCSGSRCSRRHSSSGRPASRSPSDSASAGSSSARSTAPSSLLAVVLTVAVTQRARGLAARAHGSGRRAAPRADALAAPAARHACAAHHRGRRRSAVLAAPRLHRARGREARAAPGDRRGTGLAMDHVRRRRDAPRRIREALATTAGGCSVRELAELTGLHENAVRRTLVGARRARERCVSSAIARALAAGRSCAIASSAPPTSRSGRSCPCCSTCSTPRRPPPLTPMRAASPAAAPCPRNGDVREAIVGSLVNLGFAPVEQPAAAGTSHRARPHELPVPRCRHRLAQRSPDLSPAPRPGRGHRRGHRRCSSRSSSINDPRVVPCRDPLPYARRGRRRVKPDASPPLAVLERWEAHGATWRVLTLGENLAVVELCTCHGTPVERAALE